MSRWHENQHITPTLGTRPSRGRFEKGLGCAVFSTPLLLEYVPLEICVLCDQLVGSLVPFLNDIIPVIDISHTLPVYPRNCPATQTVIL